MNNDNNILLPIIVFAFIGFIIIGSIFEQELVLMVATLIVFIIFGGATLHFVVKDYILSKSDTKKIEEEA